MLRRVEFSIEQAGAQIGRSARTIAAALASGELKGIRRGRRIFVTGKSLDNFARQRGLEPSAIMQELFTLARQLVREARAKDLSRRRTA